MIWDIIYVVQIIYAMVIFYFKAYFLLLINQITFASINSLFAAF